MSIYACILYALMAVALIVCKLFGAVAWAWEWVLAPIWAPWALAVAVLAWFGAMSLYGFSMSRR